MNAKKWLSASVGVLVCLGLGACRAVPEHSRPPVELPQKFSASGEAVLPERWWEAFGDPDLDRLVDAALSGSLSLSAMWDRLDQARASAEKAGAELYPWASGTLGYARREYAGPHSPDALDSFAFGLKLSYEVDLWGRIKSTQDAALLDLAASEQDLQAAAITLTANIAERWYQLVEQYRQHAMAGEQIDVNRKNLELIELRFQQGVVPVADVLQQRQALESSVGDRIVVEKNIRLLKHQLAALCGLPTGNLEIPPDADFPELPPSPQTGEVGDWIARRPDLRKAYLDLQASDRRIAAAVGNLYPKLGLTVNLDSTASELRDWFSNWIAALAANLAAPLFEGRQRLREIDRLEAVSSEKFHLYGEKLLNAMQEVEDAWIAEVKQREYLESLDRRCEISESVLQRTQDQYIYAQQDFLRYWNALLGDQQLRRTRITARRQLISHRIQLYKALGGAWELNRPGHQAGSSR